jgi:hypothetical protein
MECRELAFRPLGLASYRLANTTLRNDIKAVVVDQG